MPRGRYPISGHGGRAGRRGGGYRGVRGARGSSSSTQLPKGLFEGGIWKCDCTPRLPAKHLQVKKPTKNQGRWFYVCQKGENEKCGLYLWDEDAQVRMEAAVLGNSRSEPRVRDGGMVRGQGIFAGFREGDERLREAARADDDDTTTGSPSPSPLPRPAPSSSTNAVLVPTGKKRTADDACLDQGNESVEEPWSLTRQEEVELAHAANIQLPQTPQKTQKTGAYPTPNTATSRARKLPWLHEPITPPSTGTKNPNNLLAYFPNTPLPRFHLPEPEPEAVSDVPVKPKPSVTTSFPAPAPAAPAAEAPPLAPPPATAPPTAVLPITAPPLAAPPSPFQPSSDSLTSDVISALAPLRLSPATLSNLRGILARYELQTLGVMKGRDASREALRKAEARVAELEAKVVRLEGKMEYDRVVIDGLRGRVRGDPT